MTERMSSLDVSFLYLEGRTTPMHVGGLAIFEPPSDTEADRFDYEQLVTLLEERIALVPRYRQRIRFVPGHLANPVWVDDPTFDITYHVRRSALPRPGSEQQLLEFCARIQSRPLDRNRPLWEIYLVEGLTGGRIAIITKSHYAMVDGISAVDISQVILDDAADEYHRAPDLWMPAPEPSSTRLLLDALEDLVRRPGLLVDTARLAVNDLRSTADGVLGAVGGLVSAAKVAIRPAPTSPLNVAIGEQRRYAIARTSLSDYRRLRSRHSASVNDIVLATVAGALRAWLLFRGEAVPPAKIVRAMVPVSVREPRETVADGMLGNRVSAFFVDLPVGEPNPLMRLTQVAYAMKAHKESGRSVGADTIVALSGFAPPTLHALGARAANGLTRRLFNVVVTNVPGPQHAMYAADARMLEMFPVVPLAEGQAVSIGVTSYDGGVYFGLNADRDAMPDVDVLASLIEESLAELLAASNDGPGRETSGAAAVDSGRTEPHGRAVTGRRPTSSSDAQPEPKARPGHARTDRAAGPSDTDAPERR